MLESAGWIDFDGDGVREKDGRDFVFNAMVPEGANAFRLATLVQAALRQVGVQMELATMSVVILDPKVSNPDFEAATIQALAPILPGDSRYVPRSRDSCVDAGGDT